MPWVTFKDGRRVFFNESRRKRQPYHDSLQMSRVKKKILDIIKMGDIHKDELATLVSRELTVPTSVVYRAAESLRRSGKLYRTDNIYEESYE